eukprot:12125059-Heterocapsa_arctica.AAC.1
MEKEAAESERAERARKRQEDFDDDTDRGKRPRIDLKVEEKRAMDMTISKRKADGPGDDPRLEDPPDSAGAASSTAPLDAEMTEMI